MDRFYYFTAERRDLDYPDGHICPVGMTRTGPLIINHIYVPGFVVNFQCFENIPPDIMTAPEGYNTTVDFWNMSAENRRGNITRRSGGRGFWVTDAEKARIDNFLDEFLRRLSIDKGQPAYWWNERKSPPYGGIKNGHYIFLYTTDESQAGTKRVISDMTGTPLDGIVGYEEARGMVRNQIEQARQARGTSPNVFNYSAAPSRNIPQGPDEGQNSIAFSQIQNGDEMVNLLLANGRSTFPGQLYRKSSYLRIPRGTNGYRRHPTGRHRLTANLVVPYRARVSRPDPAAAVNAAVANAIAEPVAALNAVVNAAPEPVAALNAVVNLAPEPVAVVETRNQRRQRLANAAERRIRRAEGGRKRTRRAKKSKSRKH